MTDDDLAARLRTVIARTDRLLARETIRGEITRTQFSILGVLDRTGPQGLGQLAVRESVNPTMLSRIVAALEAAELIRRAPNPQDGRQVVVAVTDSGRAAYRTRQSERTALIEEYLGGLSISSTKRLRDALPVLEGLAEHLHGLAAR